MCEQCDALGIPHGSALSFGVTNNDVIMAVVSVNEVIIDHTPIGPCNEETLQRIEQFVKELRQHMLMESAIPTGKVN